MRTIKFCCVLFDGILVDACSHNHSQRKKKLSSLKYGVRAINHTKQHISFSWRYLIDHIGCSCKPRLLDPILNVWTPSLFWWTVKVSSLHLVLVSVAICQSLYQLLWHCTPGSFHLGYDLRDTDIVQWNINRDLHTPYQQYVSFRITSSVLEWLSEIFNDTKHRAASLWQQSYLVTKQYGQAVNSTHINTTFGKAMTIASRWLWQSIKFSGITHSLIGWKESKNRSQRQYIIL